jgi:ribonuclease R
MIFLRRGHGEPDFVKLKAFAEFAAALGYPIQQFQSRLALQELLDEAHCKSNERALNYALLRSMKQAEYTANDVGHYALAVDNYCHFTSPIRRYPDLTIHRQFAEIVSSKKKPKGLGPMEAEKLAKHCSETERRAARAERELIKVKLLTFLADKVGTEFDTLITGVEPFGIFCLGTELPVEGLVHISALDRDDFFDHDPRTFSLIGRRSGKQYQLGGRVRVRIASVDVDRRLLEFALASETEPASADEPSKKKSTAAREGRGTDRQQTGKRESHRNRSAHGERGFRSGAGGKGRTKSRPPKGKKKRRRR